MRMLTAAIAIFATVGHAQAPTVRPPVPGAPIGVTAFVDVDVVPMDEERVLRHQTVLVEGGRITALGATNKVKVPTGATRIDGRGQYLIPGLADMHVHIAYVENVPENLVYDSAAVEDRLFLWLANGITTVRNLDYMAVGEISGVELNGSDILRLRKRAAAGALLSPRIYTSAQWIGPDGDDPHAAWTQGIEEENEEITPSQIAAYVKAYKAAGYDFIKVRAETPAVFEAVTAAARAIGLPVVGHVPPRVSLTQVLAGMKSVEHLMGYHSYYGQRSDPSPFDHPDSLRAWAEATRRAGVWNVPTTTIFRALNGGDSLLSIVKALHDAGAGLLTGTDAPLARGPDNQAGTIPMHGNPGLIHRELEGFVTAGLTPYQALAAGTRNVAVYFETLDETGTVAEGKRADLLLLQGNPLEDIRHTAHPSGVMIGGRWLAREEIDRHVAEIMARVS